MLTVLANLGGTVHKVPAVDPVWLDPESGVTFWVDLAAPTPEESSILRSLFHFHELAIEDSLAESHHPKVESYGTFLYVILHGIDFEAAKHRFATHDTDFFVGPNHLVTVHDGTSRSIAAMREVCERNEHVLSKGPVELLHRIVDAMVDNYLPEVEKLSDRLEQLEHRVFDEPNENLVKPILDLKRDVGSLRRVLLPQRDVVGRLARREFAVITEQLSYRFRDVYDHLVRLTDESMLFHDRLSSLLDAHLTSVSTRLNQVMKVLTVIATIFMPLTVLTGMWGMNVPLPVFPGSEGMQFWWIVALMGVTTGAMLWLFRLRRWM
ncbi:magnesium/cobalt transporter CorA [Candidatus Binatia bacterium]|nr:magnesium/cobalt transporter CorA [Candidatus Binatia bacterium]